jgi:hypothetical protein
MRQPPPGALRLKSEPSRKLPTPPVRVPARAGYCWATVRVNAGPDWPDIANCDLLARPDFLTCGSHASREQAAQLRKNNLP